MRSDMAVSRMGGVSNDFDLTGGCWQCICPPVSSYRWNIPAEETICGLSKLDNWRLDLATITTWSKWNLEWHLNSARFPPFSEMVHELIAFKIVCKQQFFIVSLSCTNQLPVKVSFIFFLFRYLHKLTVPDRVSCWRNNFSEDARFKEWKSERITTYRW